MALADDTRLPEEANDLIVKGVRKQLEDMVRASVEDEFRLLLDECIEETAKQLQIRLQSHFDDMLSSTIVNVMIKKGNEDGI